MTCGGVVLAAGAGSRYGRPKALVEDWLERATRALAEGGCEDLVVVLGASAEHVRVPAGARAVLAADWADGRSASLRAGLAALDAEATVAVVTLVDIPDVGAAVTRRLLLEPTTATTLRRAAYDGRPGHPVVIGREHWPALSGLSGDDGAGGYLDRHRATRVECRDLATGRDHDTPTGTPDASQENR